MNEKPYVIIRGAPSITLLIAVLIVLGAIHGATLVLDLVAAFVALSPS